MAVLFAGLPRPTTFIVTSLVMMAFVANATGLAMLVQINEPKPLPFAEMLEVTYW